jgi:antitoxin YefM
MEIRMTTIQATQARKQFFELVKGVTDGHKTVRIQHKVGAAVLMSEEEYESLIETLELQSVPGFNASLKRSKKQELRGETYSMKDVFGE